MSKYVYKYMPPNTLYDDGIIASVTKEEVAKDIVFLLNSDVKREKDLISYKKGEKFNFGTWVVFREKSNPEWGEYSL